MKFPYVVLKNLKKELVERWKSQYEEISNDRNRKIDEGLWRRSQLFYTRHQSNWRSAQDMRRRIIYYMHQYDLIKNEEGNYDLCMVDSYIWLHLCFPIDELNAYYNDITNALRDGKWCKKECEDDVEVYINNDLSYSINRMDVHMQDIKQKRTLPNNYKILEITIKTKDFIITEEMINKPWGVYNKGPRHKEITQPPKPVDINEIIKYLPAQVELGCGPSIEAGIPPLYYLHEVYYVSNPISGKFILGAEQDKLASNIAKSTEAIYKKFSNMYKCCFLAEPTDFYTKLKILKDKGYIVGPIITNNFDGLSLRVGLDEMYVRRYEEDFIIPRIQFNPNAKSLIVFGSHADRRKIHQASRAQGLKIFFIDPEGYYSENGFIPYKLEGTHSSDFILKETASVAMQMLIKELGIE